MSGTPHEPRRGHLVVGLRVVRGGVRGHPGADMSARSVERFPETFDEVVAAEVGHVFCDEFEDGVRFVILRGPASLCAYLGISTAHPLAGWDYDDLPISCHYGLTYAGTEVHGDGSTYWYGWDYSHSGDRSTYDRLSGWREDETPWTPALVYDDSWDARWEFKKLVGLAEKITRRPVAS